MTSHMKFVICLLCTGVAFAEIAYAQADATVQDARGGSPVAYVYASSAGKYVYAFAATSNGKLTPVPGSPFPGDVPYSMAAKGKYLFGTDGVYIYSFSIADDGALKPITAINAQQFNGYRCGGPTALFLDHTGSTLYDLDYDGNACANNAYQFFNVNDSTGGLFYLGVTGDSSVEFEVPLSFTGNNVYAYGAGCWHLNASIFGFKRNRDQTLTMLHIDPAMPAPKDGDFYCPSLPTADPTNHLAISFQAYNAQSWQPDGPPQLGTYTADSSGNLTTKSSFSNMPENAVKYVTDTGVSPSGKLLAVAGMAGLQIFHFNGSKPISHYTGLLTKDQIDQFSWDNDSHLYAISQSAGKLFVFTITPTSVKQAPGSPHTITGAQNIVVLPKR
jgi:hypothetical protein